MKILVTGGTVFVSKFIAEYFCVRGHEVLVLNRNTRPQLPHVKLIECDRGAIGSKLRGLYFDAVIDVNAYNAKDIDNLLDGLDAFNTYVMISSSAVYPETLDTPFKESDRTGENKFWGEYGKNKIAAESALVKRLGNAYIIRPPYLYGEYNNIYREGFVFDRAEKNEPFYLPKDGAMPLQFFHIEDLCRFINAILELQPDNKVFNVGNAPISIKEWVNICYNAVGSSPEFINVYSNIEQRNYFPFYDYAYELDTSRQAEILSDLLPMDIGIKRAYAWYKKNKDQVNIRNYDKYIKQNFSLSQSN